MSKYSNPLSRYVVPALYLVLCVACISPPQDYTQSKPTRDEISGTWVPDEDTRKLMRVNGEYDPSVNIKLELQKDGTFKMANMPDWWINGFGKSSKRFVSFFGKWQVWQPSLSKNWVVLMESENNFREVDILGQAAPYRLYFIIGDPDADTAMVFIKKL